MDSSQVGEGGINILDGLPNHCHILHRQEPAFVEKLLVKKKVVNLTDL